jgi:hypothetical protein
MEQWINFEQSLNQCLNREALVNRALVPVLLILVLLISSCQAEKDRLLLFNELSQQKNISSLLVSDIKSYADSSYLGKIEIEINDIIRAYQVAENNFNSLISQLKVDVVSDKNVANINSIYKPLLKNAKSSATVFSEKVNQFISKYADAGVGKGASAVASFVVGAKIPANLFTTPDLLSHEFSESLKSISQIITDIKEILNEQNQISSERRAYFLSELDKLVWEDFDKIKPSYFIMRSE